jgi:hypothetical protein
LEFTKTTFLTPMPVFMSKAILGDQDLITKEAQENSGIFNYQMYVRRNLVCPFIRSKYIDLTVKKLVFVRFDIKRSGS